MMKNRQAFYNRCFVPKNITSDIDTTSTETKIQVQVLTIVNEIEMNHLKLFLYGELFSKFILYTYIFLTKNTKKD